MDGVVMLVNEFPPLPVGGAERQAERLAGYMAARNWPVWVVTRGASGLPAREQRDGFTIIRPATLGAGKLRTLSFVFGALWALWQLRDRYQILHAHLAFGPAFAAVAAGRALGKRVIVKLGNSGEFGDIQVSQCSWRGRLRLAVLRRWADVVIVLDDQMQREALANGFVPEQLKRMHNGVDARAFSPKRGRAEAKASLGLEGKTVALYMGRLAEQKNLGLLLEALAQALPDCPDLFLLLVGDGPERAKLERQSAALGIDDRVAFYGSQQEVLAYLEAADLFVLPSASEGISNALLEAMSAGLACLATPVGGSAEALDQCGLLLSLDDVKAWRQGLVALGNDPGQAARLGTAARQRIQDQYDFSVVGARYEALYRALQGASNPQPVFGSE